MNVFQCFNKVTKELFFLFTFLLIAFGRIFSLSHISTPFAPLYVTEITLLLSLPFVVSRFREFKNIPATLSLAGSLFMLYGTVRFIESMVHGRTIALRDIVFFVYPLFFCCSFLYSFKSGDLKKWIYVILLGNFFGIIFSRICFIGFPTLPEPFKTFASETKVVHFGFYLGIGVAFLFSFYKLVQSKIARFFMLLLLALNIYMIFIFSQRTTWLGLVILMLFLWFVLRADFVKIVIRVFLITVLLFPILYYFDYIHKPTRMFHADIFESIKETQTRNVQNSKILGAVSAIQKLEKAREELSRTPNSVSSTLLHPISHEVEITKQIFNINHLAKNYTTGDDLAASSVYSIFWRIDSWIKFIRYAVHFNAMFGVGFGRYPGVYGVSHHNMLFSINSARQAELIPPHNHLVSVFYKLGFLGLVLYLLILVYPLIAGMVFLSTDPKVVFLHCMMIAVLGSLLYWNICAFFFDFIESPPTNVFLWILTGLVYGITQRTHGNDVKNEF